MNRYLATLYLLSASLVLNAQGNLQFNQVINLTNGQTYTVPAGKVLKVESLHIAGSSQTVITNLSSCNGGSCVYNAFAFQLGDASIQNYSNSATVANCSLCPPTRSGTYSATNPTIYLPMWLPAGKVCTVAGGTGLLMTGIEFNIVP